MKKIGTQSLIAGILSIIIFSSVTYFGGIFAMILNAALAIAAIILGSISIKSDDKSQKVQGIIGLILGVLTILISLGLILFNN